MNKYIVFMNQIDLVFNIEKIFRNNNGKFVEYIIESKKDLEQTLDSFGEDGQKIYNILTNVKLGSKFILGEINGITIPEGIRAVGIREESLKHHRYPGNTIILPPYHTNNILI